ncbi:MAG: hypothetical protein ABIP65_07800 [Vicinamibacterales bacterium]
MNLFLTTLTGVSLAIAAGIGVLLARMWREERRRSDARVQLLRELAGEGAPLPAQPRAAASTAVAHERPGISAAPPLRTAVPLDELELRPGARDVVHVPDLFHQRPEPSAWPRRCAVIGAMAALVALTVFGYRQATPAGGVAATPRVGAPTGSASREAAPLELLSLRHTNEETMLTITGQVRNPRSGRALTRVSATVFVFGGGGSIVTSGRAPLDFTALAPGEDSSFVIRVPMTGGVERYRIGFRGGDDRVLAHIDRRSPDTLAQKQVP